MKKLYNRKSKVILIGLPALILGIVIYLLTMNNIYTKSYEIDRYNRATETIRSPITIENELETERRIRETIQSVGDRYVTLEKITEEQVKYIEEVFDVMTKLEKLDEDELKLLDEDEKIKKVKELLSTELNETLPDQILVQIMKINDKNRTKAKEFYLPKLTKILESGVRFENIQSSKEELNEEIKFSKLDANLKVFLNDLTEFAIVENAFFDVEKTMEARKSAVNRTEPVVIRAGEIIVREDQIITNEIYDQLELVGLLNEQKNLYPGIGLILFIVFLVSIIAYEMNKLYVRNELDRGKILSIVIISILVVAFMKIVSVYTSQTNQMYLLVPVATGVLLIKQIIHERFSIVLATIYAVIGSIVFNGEIPGSLNFEAGIYFYFFQMAGIMFLTNVKDRLIIIQAGIGMAVVNVITVLIFTFLSFEKYALKELLIQSGFGISSALLAAVLTLGLLPVFETGLGMLSDNKLLALANPNQPLLRKILTEAPGTYHHSVMVANLSETTCEAIGANGLLARVGSYYHDIGKTLNPHYFIENQVAIRNPHDFISPEESAEIIINHVLDGEKMLKEHKMPKEIIDICLQHHGTSLVGYFYHQAKEKDPNVSEDLFRYPGPKPQTKESGVISICDSVEAAVRSLKEPTHEKIDEIVTMIIDNRLRDGQFDETPLTFEDLKIVHITVCEALKGIFHSRIQYPSKEE